MLMLLLLLLSLLLGKHPVYLASRQTRQNYLITIKNRKVQSSSDSQWQ